MKISIDTKEDTHEDIKKVIKMLQHIVGDTQEIFINQSTDSNVTSPMANIFGDTSSSSSSQETQVTQETSSSSSDSTEDLFAELFSEEELKKMNTVKEEEDEDEEEELESKSKSKSKKPDIEFY